ncbi:MAG: RelA/SpoT family protein [Candidatus Jorgensenbacteria bacterium]
MDTGWLQKYPQKSPVYEAYNFAKEAHKDKERESGEPYFSHCEAVAKTVSGWGLDQESVAAAFLHDVIEDTGYTLRDIEKRFGKEIASIVDGLTKLDKVQYPEKNQDIETLRKFIISFSRDLRVVIIKLADRHHNMLTLKFLPPERQKLFAWETSEIYAPLAYRLGMQRLSGELEDLAFPYLHPDEYKWLLKNVKEKYEEREKYAEKMKPVVRRLLVKNGIKPITIDSRAKHYSSLYKKLHRHDMDFEKIYDLMALRIIVKTVEDCYTVLGIIHKVWPPLPGRIKDYIARPKSNGYRSLHTTVFAEDNKITEFQIRTEEMHKKDEFGIAAHWAYEQVKGSRRLSRNWRGVRNHKELLWVEQLRHWQQNISDKNFVDSLAGDFFKDRIFVITPHNDVIDLPLGATPVDFAYHIHSEIGNQCVGAKVNGKIVPLDYQLHSSDVVEIMTQRGKKPSGDWLRFIKTSLARDQVKEIIRKVTCPPAGREPKSTEFKIVNHDRPGFLKDITAEFGARKINIIYLQSTTDKRGVLATVTIKTEPLSKSRIEKLIVKIKSVEGVKEVSSKLNR